MPELKQNEKCSDLDRKGKQGFTSILTWVQASKFGTFNEVKQTEYDT